MLVYVNHPKLVFLIVFSFFPAEKFSFTGAHQMKLSVEAKIKRRTDEEQFDTLNGFVWLLDVTNKLDV